jgi:hypothetical protein
VVFFCERAAIAEKGREHGQGRGNLAFHLSSSAEGAPAASAFERDASERKSHRGVRTKSLC